MVKIVISRGALYIIAITFTLIFVGMGVYAYGTSSPSVLGHTFSEIAAPSGCSSGQYLEYTLSGWTCQTPSTGVSLPSTSCTGTNKVIQWTGSSWTCATVSI